MARWCAFAGVLLSWAGGSWAQTTGTLAGVVRDASTGQPIEAAIVEVSSPHLQGSEVAATDAGGRFLLQLLPPGTYALHVEASGYRSATHRGIVVSLGATVRVNLSLQKQTVALRRIVVNARRLAPVDQGSTTSGVIIDEALLRTLPLGRGYESALVAAPGSSIADARAGIGFAGATGSENVFLVDGLNTTNPGFGYQGTRLPPEFLEQIEVKTGGYLPEFGRAMGGVVNTLIKSGGNQFHGDVFFHLTTSGLQPAAERTQSGIFAFRDDLLWQGDVGMAVGGADHRGPALVLPRPRPPAHPAPLAPVRLPAARGSPDRRVSHR